MYKFKKEFDKNFINLYIENKIFSTPNIQIIEDLEYRLQ